MQVILDSDLAKLYGVETKRINEAVKNNPHKFTERFSCILTNEEIFNLRSKFSTSSLEIKSNNYGGRRYKIRVFTEQGVSMLSTILKTKVAIEVSIRIMDAFVYMRKYISTNLIEQKYINNLVLQDNERINILEETFSKFEDKKVINQIFFNGQIYDAFSKIIDIFNEAKKELIIIDAYADKIVFDIVSNLKINVILITKEKNKLKALEIQKYNEQYNNLKIIYDKTFHDRYFILDHNLVYHCGTSINHIGNKTFSINKLEDIDVISSFLKHIDQIIYQNN